MIVIRRQLGMHADKLEAQWRVLYQLTDRFRNESKLGSAPQSLVDKKHHEQLSAAAIVEQSHQTKRWNERAGEKKGKQETKLLLYVSPNPSMPRRRRQHPRPAAVSSGAAYNRARSALSSAALRPGIDRGSASPPSPVLRARRAVAMASGVAHGRI